jgi:hypothetical protein
MLNILQLFYFNYLSSSEPTKKAPEETSDAFLVELAGTTPASDC